MNATTAILKNLDVEKILDYYKFDNIKFDGNFIRAACKIHNGSNPTAFVIDMDNGLWYCHTNCGGGDIFTLVQLMEKIDFISAVHWLSSFYDVNIENLQIIERKTKYLKDIKSFMDIVKNKKQKILQEFCIKEEIKQVTKYRNFNLETLQHFKLGYAKEITLISKKNEEYKLQNRLVFPIIFNNIQIGISLRRINNTDYPKWSHQPINIATKNILYNYDDAKTSNQIVICEGITDVWAFYEIDIQAVATFGAHITKEQYKLLLKTGADLIFAFDGDETGQIALKKALEMFKYKANVKLIKFKPNEDPESLDRNELRERLNGL